MYMYTCVCIHIYTCIYINIYTYIYVYVHVNIYIYIYVYIHIPIYTYGWPCCMYVCVRVCAHVSHFRAQVSPKTKWHKLYILSFFAQVSQYMNFFLNTHV